MYRMGHFNFTGKGSAFVNLMGVDLKVGLGLGLDLLVGFPVFLRCMLGINV